MFRVRRAFGGLTGPKWVILPFSRAFLGDNSGVGFCDVPSAVGHGIRFLSFYTYFARCRVPVVFSEPL